VLWVKGSGPPADVCGHESARPQERSRR
jgi:hypothetical protein